MTKVFIFDADGVLLLGDYFSKAYAKEYGVPTEEIDPFFHNEFIRCVTGETDVKDVLPPYLKKWKWEGTVDEFLTYWFKEETVLNPDLIEKINELREQGHKCYFASNQEKYRAMYLLKKLHFDTLFDACFFSSALKVKKPTQEFFSEVFDHISEIQDIKKEDCIFWDDHNKNVDAANTFGMQAYLYTGFESFLKQLEHHL